MQQKAFCRQFRPVLLLTKTDERFDIAFSRAKMVADTSARWMLRSIFAIYIMKNSISFGLNNRSCRTNQLNRLNTRYKTIVLVLINWTVVVCSLDWWERTGRSKLLAKISPDWYPWELFTEASSGYTAPPVLHLSRYHSRTPVLWMNNNSTHAREQGRETHKRRVEIKNKSSQRQSSGNKTVSTKPIRDFKGEDPVSCGAAVLKLAFVFLHSLMS